MEVSEYNAEFLNSFSHDLNNVNLPRSKSIMNLFIHNIVSNSFDYDTLKARLLDPLISFSLSRRTQEKYRLNPGKLSKTAREKFRSKDNRGELGELLLYCFLESHLKAPKILSKLELKTSSKMYVNGSDGIHFLKLPNNDYQIIFGESKTYKDLSEGLSQAFESIYDFLKEVNSDGEAKSGIMFERSLISQHIENEIFSKEEAQFIESLIYPSASKEYKTDNAFGIFIGYEINFTSDEKLLDNNSFRDLILKRIKTQVENTFESIDNLISKKHLEGYNFYLYILPFTELDDAREKIINYII